MNMDNCQISRSCLEPSAPPASHITCGGKFCLSNQVQLEMLQGLAERGASLRTTVRGFSMSPFVKDMDVLIISPPVKKVKVGDIAAFRHPVNGRLTLHRLIRKVESGWLVRGDNCSRPDGIIQQQDILGLVVSARRKSRKLRLGITYGKKLIAWLSLFNLLLRIKKIQALPVQAYVADNCLPRETTPKEFPKGFHWG